MYSIHIQLFTQNRSLRIKRLEWIKLNNTDDDGNGNDTTTAMTTTQVEVKDGYYKQDKDDDKCVYVLMGILLYSIHIQFFSQNQSLLLLSLI